MFSCVILLLNPWAMSPSLTELIMKHPHYDVIVAWAEGKPIQRFNLLLNQWRDWPRDVSPGFSPEGQYRIKPQPLTAFQIYMDAAYPGHVCNEPSAAVDRGFTAVINAVKTGELK